jgi:hypothetical protein
MNTDTDPEGRVARRTVWADARTPEEALFGLLDGRLVYDTADVARRVTGREPIEVVIVAKTKTENSNAR